MVSNMRLSLCPLLVLIFLAAACDPGVQFGWEKDFERDIDGDCIEEALKTISSDVLRSRYVSGGGRGFPKGTEVIQFSYPGPRPGHYILELGLLPNGKTRYVHAWSKLGTKIPTEEQAGVAPLLYEANNAVARLCSLTFSGTQPAVGPG